MDCTLRYSVDDFFRMAGGSMQQGRVDNTILDQYMSSYDPFFRVYLDHREDWTDFISFMQRISQGSRDGETTLTVHGLREQKGDHSRKVTADPELFAAMERIGFLSDVQFTEDEVSFCFADQQIRSWLRDVGSVLELYMYKACRDTGIFHDVVSSAVVLWDDEKAAARVSNEIDVAAAREVTPLFISCKACDVKTEALNELAILRDRFGGKGAKAVIATTERCSAAARHRAAQLGIAVIDLEEMETGRTVERLRVIMKAQSEIENE